MSRATKDISKLARSNQRSRPWDTLSRLRLENVCNLANQS